MRREPKPSTMPDRTVSRVFKSGRLVALAIVAALSAGVAYADTRLLESPAMRVEIDSQTGKWSLVDKASGIRWPSAGAAGAGAASGLASEFAKTAAASHRVRLETAAGAAVTFELVDDGRALEIRYEGQTVGDVRVLDDALAVTAAEEGYAVVPCRAGLLIPAASGVDFSQTFGTSDYEGCHMNMIGLVKRGSAILATWDDAYVFASEERSRPAAMARSGSRPASTSAARHARSALPRSATATGTRWRPAIGESPNRKAWPSLSARRSNGIPMCGGWWARRISSSGRAWHGG